MKTIPSQRNRFLIMVVTCVFAVGFTASVFAEPLGLDALSPLVGDWRGVGDGKWGRASAERRYKRVLDNQYIHGFTRTVYPKQEKNKNGELHDTVGYFSIDTQKNLLVLREFDNEAIVATYYLDITLSSDQRLVFEAKSSENVPGDWRARVSLEFKDSDEFHEFFELDTGKGEFELYLTTKFLRIRNQ